MARIPRIFESVDGNPNGEHDEGTLENRRQRVLGILRQAERLAEVSTSVQKAGRSQEARILRKRAHQEVRLTERLIGILVIEFYQDMDEEVKRVRRVLEIVKTPAPAPS